MVHFPQVVCSGKRPVRRATLTMFPHHNIFKCLLLKFRYFQLAFCCIERIVFLEFTCSNRRWTSGHVVKTDFLLLPRHVAFKYYNQYVGCGGSQIERVTQVAPGAEENRYPLASTVSDQIEVVQTCTLCPTKILYSCKSIAMKFSASYPDDLS